MLLSILPVLLVRPRVRFARDAFISSSWVAGIVVCPCVSFACIIFIGQVLVIFLDRKSVV